jgi:hypothetical protein
MKTAIYKNELYCFSHRAEPKHGDVYMYRGELTFANFNNYDGREFDIYVSASQQFALKLIPVTEGGLTNKELNLMRNALSDLNNTRISLVFANAILDAVN